MKRQAVCTLDIITQQCKFHSALQIHIRKKSNEFCSKIINQTYHWLYPSEALLHGAQQTHAAVSSGIMNFSLLCLLSSWRGTLYKGKDMAENQATLLIIVIPLQLSLTDIELQNYQIQNFTSYRQVRGCKGRTSLSHTDSN